MTTISIITATLNAAATVGNCLRSVASQTHLAQHIIIDGASTDKTLEIVRGVNPHARITSEKDNGIYDAMNKGIALASGDIIGILNADDFYESPLVLEKVMSVFDNPEVMCCYGDLEYVRLAGGQSRLLGDDGTVTTETQKYKVVRYWQSGSFTPRSFYWGWMPPHPTFFVRSSVYEQYGGFRLDMGSSADYELMLRFLLKHRLKTVYIPEVLVRMRVGGVSNATISARLKANKMDRRAWKVNGLRPHPWTITMKPLRKIRQYVLNDMI